MLVKILQIQKNDGRNGITLNGNQNISISSYWSYKAKAFRIQRMHCTDKTFDESIFIPSFWLFHSSPIPRVYLHQPSNRSEKFLSPPIQ